MPTEKILSNVSRILLVLIAAMLLVFIFAGFAGAEDQTTSGQSNISSPKTITTVPDTARRIDPAREARRMSYTRARMVMPGKDLEAQQPETTEEAAQYEDSARGECRERRDDVSRRIFMFRR